MSEGYQLNRERGGWPRAGRPAGRGAVTRAFRRAPGRAACPAFLAGFADRARTRISLPIQLIQCAGMTRLPLHRGKRVVAFMSYFTVNSSVPAFSMTTGMSTNVEALSA